MVQAINSARPRTPNNSHPRDRFNDPYVPFEERWETGKRLRERVPREKHSGWTPSKDRPDPIELLIKSNSTRVPELVPIRHARMLTSSFAFLRGSAAVMASDLSRTPKTGIRVQACGDCHLLNFGAFATPERQLIFDINDFDETLPAPWEWDLRRLAASFAVAARYHQSESSRRQRRERVRCPVLSKIDGTIFSDARTRRMV
jgi:acyl-CoA synthetase (AMP-forming)/AMP-acid ligase II